MTPREQIAFYALAILHRSLLAGYPVDYLPTADDVALKALRPLPINTILNAYLQLCGDK
jgi:hypothetical protein